MSPLADKLRPKTLDDVVGQRHLLGPRGILRRVIESGEIPNMIFFGPPGVGKTTVANIIAERSGKKLHRLNGTTAALSDIKAVAGEIGSLSANSGILLYLDEIQYLNKKQQQSLLEFVEDGSITLIASTTENPYFYVYGALLSRSTLFEFKPVDASEIRRAAERAVAVLAESEERTIEADAEALDIIAAACGGDVRKAMNAVELAALCSDDGHITAETAREVSQRSSMRFDRDGDDHYDALSALQKSLRGSDPDAAIYYLARILSGGDLLSACRRIMVCACEDVGLAYPQIIPIVKACVDAALQVGMPEARLPLADAAVLIATAPKSNSAHNAINKAMEDIKNGRVYDPPGHLRDGTISDAKRFGRGVGYQYPHEFPNHWVRQQYLPDALTGTVYYEPGENKVERAARAYWDEIKSKK